MELTENCPKCRNPQVVVARDFKATRSCAGENSCGHKWLPEECPTRWIFEGNKAVEKKIRLIPKEHMDYGSPGYEFLDTKINGLSIINSAATKKELLEGAILREKDNIEALKAAIKKSEQRIELYEVQL